MQNHAQLCRFGCYSIVLHQHAQSFTYLVDFHADFFTGMQNFVKVCILNANADAGFHILPHKHAPAKIIKNITFRTSKSCNQVSDLTPNKIPIVLQTNGRSGVCKSAPPSGTTGSDLFSPLSKAKLTHPKTEYEFHTTLLNAKLAELVSHRMGHVLRMIILLFLLWHIIRDNVPRLITVAPKSSCI